MAYDTARQREVNDVAQAEANLREAEQQLEALFSPNASDLAQAQAAVTQAQANLDKLRQGGTAAEITQAQASVTQAQADLEKLTAPGTEATIASAEANLLQAQANVAQAQRNLEQAALTAPFDGVVATVGASVGATAGASAVTLVDLSKLHIVVNLSETDAAKVQVGQPVALTFDALPGASLTGRVATIAPAATVSQNVVTYPVQVEFEPDGTPVKVGMSATADIQVEQIEQAILVPSRAVQTSGKTKTVTLVRGDQQPPLSVPVTTGPTNNGQTVITSSGGKGLPALKAGDTISVPRSTTTTTTATGAQNSRGLLGGPAGGPPPGP